MGFAAIRVGVMNRIMGLIVLSALAGCFLLIADLGERPRFDRVAIELALLAPLPLWFLGRRLRLPR